ncbi:MAG: NrfD/PsrC family molybdoenzyme membrane anchor subunit, partial [Myxococcota bacterium]
YWHWPIPAYLVTKHVAGGAFLYLAVRALGGSFDPTAMAFGGGLGLAALLVTFALLIYDLDRPDRFLFLFTRPQWRSWIARAAWLLAGFSALAGGWWAVELGLGAGVLPQGLASLRPAFAAVVAPVAVLAAVYSAFLFAQAEGRDLWQAPHLVVLLGAQAVLLGAVPFAAAGDPVAAGWVVAGALSALLLALVDLRTLHGTEVARLAALELTRGRFRWWWRGGIAVGYLAPLAAIAAGVPLLAAIAAPIGVHLASYALVMAPQAIRNS